MYPGYSYPFTAYIQMAVLAQWFLVLGYLVALREIGVKIILPLKKCLLVNRTIQRQAGQYDFFDRINIRNGQRSRVPKTHRTYVDIGVFLIRVIQRIAEHF